MDSVNICIMSHMSICWQEQGAGAGAGVAPVISIYVCLSWPEMIVDRANTLWGVKSGVDSRGLINGVMSGLLS